MYQIIVNDWFTHDLNPLSGSSKKQGLFYEANIELEEIGDTYIDVSNFQKGYVFVNDKNLGRYWNIGP